MIAIPSLVADGPAGAMPADGAAPASSPAPGSVPHSGTGRNGRTDHGGQIGLSVMPGIGYRMIVRYDEDQICVDATGPDSKWICTNDVPAFVDIGLAFGLTPKLDVITDLRLGLARDDAPGIGRQFTLMPGVRFWLDRQSRWKFFTTVQLVHDRTGQSQDAVSDSDWGARNANGIIFDPNRRYGVFFQLGETLAFARWFRIEIDVGVGVQVRYP